MPTPLSMRLITFLIIHFIALQVHALPGTEKLTKLSVDTLPQPNFRYPALVGQFYKLVRQPYPWVRQKTFQGTLVRFIHAAERWGLREQDYSIGLLDSLYDNRIVLKGMQDTLYTDEIFTNAAIHFFHDMAIGNISQPVGYQGLKYLPDCVDIPGFLALAITNNLLEELPDAVEPQTPDYKAIKNTLAQLLEIRNDTTSHENRAEILIDKLTALNILPYALHKNNLARARQVIPIRIREASMTLNTIRWARCVQEIQCIVINIPSATLQYYEEGKLLLQSKVIVGKRSTPTSTLSSQIFEIVLYPYWTVPSKIASRELLPMIKRNPSFLDENGYQVISAGKVIDGATVDWKKYSSTNFPFTLRQSTGCDNSLGIIKFNFYSPYGIYLHDTPWKSLFNVSKRHLSHGCVRVEKVAELAKLLLKEDSTAFNGVLQKGDSLNTKPTSIPLTQAVPVIIVYNTAWPDQVGTVRFYDDVYQKTTYQTRPE